MCYKAVNRCFWICFYTWLVQNLRIAWVVSEDPILMTYCPDRYKDQIVCDEAVDDCLAVLKFISDLFVIGKMLEKFHNVLLDNDDILFLNQDLNKAIVFANEMGILL